MRPLFIWIVGILLQIAIPGAFLGLVTWVLAIGLLLVAWLLARKQTLYMYDARWMWGVLFFLLLFSLSSAMTLEADSREPVKNTRLLQLADEWRQQRVHRLDSLHLSTGQRSLLVTITLGDRSKMSREVRQQFSVTGVSHVLAVSGFHVAVVCGFVVMLLRLLPHFRFEKTICYLLTIILLWAYVCVTGMPPSAVRAGVMLSLFLTGQWLRRQTDGYNTWAASAFCMLVYDPYLLFHIGFQLSYLAVLSILYLQPRLSGLIEVRNPLIRVPWQWVTVAVSAQVGTAFLCLHYFGYFSLVFLFTNLPITLLSFGLIPLTLSWMLLPHNLPGMLCLQQVIEWLTCAMMQVVELFAAIPGATWSCRFSWFSMLSGYAMLLCLLLYLRSRRARLLIATLFFLLLLLVGLLISKEEIVSEVSSLSIIN